MALNSNQVKSLQAGVHADGGVSDHGRERRSGAAFRITDLDGVRAQMALAGAGERESTAASAPNHARDYKVTLKCDGVVPCVEKRPGKT